MTPQEVTLRDVLDAELRGVRESIDSLAKQVADAHAQSSREHAEVRADLRDLRRQIDTGVPSNDEFQRFKELYHERHEALKDRIDRVEDDADQQRAVERWKRRAFAALTGAGGLAVSVVALVLR